jgi:hypothetical protein
VSESEDDEDEPEEGAAMERHRRAWTVIGQWDANKLLTSEIEAEYFEDGSRINDDIWSGSGAASEGIADQVDWSVFLA